MKLHFPLSILVLIFSATSCNSDEEKSESTNEDTIQNTVDDPEEPTEDQQQQLQTIINDMTLPHEGIPNGVLDREGWYKGPRVGYGNNPPSDWTAMIPWGQVYTDTMQNYGEGIRFQIRNLQTWYLSKTDRTWKVWDSTSNIGGANYAEDFQDDVNTEADIRSESDNAGGISASLVPGTNFHFWSDDGRTTIDPNDIAGVWSSVESRLISDSTQETGELDDASLMMSVGSDYWSTLDAQWDQWKTNGDIYIGRFRYLTPQWQTFYAHSLSEEELRANPPPFDD